ANLSKPLIPGIFGYVFGKESIQVGRLDVPPELENRRLTVIATQEGFELRDHDGNRLAQGKVSSPVEIKYGSGTGTLLHDELKGRPGARYTLIRHSRLAVIEQLQNDMTIDELNKPSGVLHIALEGPDPAQTAAIVNAIVSAYVRQNIERRA